MNMKTMVVGNWKMHLNVHEASLLAHRLHQHIAVHREVEVVLAPSMLTLQPLSLEIDRRKFKLAAQNAYFKDEGAFTGEVSFTMLQDLVHYVVIGHSERRIYFNEDLDTIRNKVAAAVRNGITPILCIGETKQEHAEGEGKQVIHDQLTTALADLTSEDMDKIVLVYEPQWTITSFGGTPAKPDEVEKAIAYMRRQVSELYGNATAEEVRVLYGGSVDEHDVRAYLEVPGCNGVLVGSASLNYRKFAAIIDAAYHVRQEQKD